MTHKQIRQCQKELADILAGPEAAGNPRNARLAKLAAKVGASGKGKSQGGITCTASEPELIDNIHFALQTASMIDMCRTASKNYCIAFVSVLVALVAAMAAWAAVYLNILDAMEKTLF